MPPVAERARGRSRRGGSYGELLVIVALAIALALGIQAVLVKPFQIPTGSMIPTLAEDQRVLVDRVTTRFSEPDVGDIVVFKPPAGADTGACGVDHPSDQACPRPTGGESEMNFIKRIVAGPGDELRVVDGRVELNGELLEEPYLEGKFECGTCDLTEPITVPPDHFFMMGDNRDSSSDSRVWGPVPEDSIIGQAFFTYWPLDRVGGL